MWYFKKTQINSVREVCEVEQNYFFQNYGLINFIKVHGV